MKGKDMGNSILEQYLQNIENMANTVKMEDMYLWPHTPVGKSDQSIICNRCGASDYDFTNKNSRPYKIINSIKNLVGSFSGGVIDITCADALIISRIKLAYPEINVYGVDCAKEEFNYTQDVLDSGVKLYKGYIQHLFKTKPETNFDVAIMLNTYRGWHSAQFKDCDKDLPKIADEWLLDNSRFCIVTAMKNQIKALLKKGANVKIIGKGESDSIMIMFSKKEKCENNILVKIKNYFRWKLFL